MWERVVVAAVAVLAALSAFLNRRRSSTAPRAAGAPSSPADLHSLLEAQPPRPANICHPRRRPASGQRRRSAPIDIPRRQRDAAMDEEYPCQLRWNSPEFQEFFKKHMMTPRNPTRVRSCPGPFRPQTLCDDGYFEEPGEVTAAQTLHRHNDEEELGYMESAPV